MTWDTGVALNWSFARPDARRHVCRIVERFTVVTSKTKDFVDFGAAFIDPFASS